jgi:hypothetical protein
VHSWIGLDEQTSSPGDEPIAPLTQYIALDELHLHELSSTPKMAWNWVEMLGNKYKTWPLFSGVNDRASRFDRN